VSVGAVLLAYVLWQEDRALAGSRAPTSAAPLAGVAPTDQGDLV
jgi:hypothetical protein